MDAARLLDGVNGDDVRVIERRHRLRLALEPSERVGLGRQPLRQDLDGNVAIEAQVMGLVDDAHAALTELRDDHIRTEGGTWSQGHRRSGSYACGARIGSLDGGAGQRSLLDATSLRSASPRCRLRGVRTAPRVELIPGNLFLFQERVVRRPLRFDLGWVRDWAPTVDCGLSERFKHEHTRSGKVYQGVSRRPL